MKKIYNKRAIGKQYEEKAAAWLTEKGCKIRETNFSCRSGEIDIIMMDGIYIVFVEVKYRKKQTYGLPEESITLYKRKSLLQSARYYLYKNNLPEEQPCRFDVVAFLGEEIRWIQNAIE